MSDLKQLIREIPDWPKPGILFYDITTLMKDGPGFAEVIDGLVAAVQPADVDVVIGIEARGFFFAPTVAKALGKGFVPVRKPKKLPAAVEAVDRDDQLSGHRRHRRYGPTRVTSAAWHAPLLAMLPRAWPGSRWL